MSAEVAAGAGVLQTLMAGLPPAAPIFIIHSLDAGAGPQVSFSRSGPTRTNAHYEFVSFSATAKS